MGKNNKLYFQTLNKIKLTSCLEKEKEAVAKRSPSLRQQKLDYSSPSVVSADTCVKASTPHEWVLELRSTWPLSSNTCVPKSWNWPGTPLVITKRHESSLVTSLLLSRMMKN